jgi:hypothetical protein
MQEANEDVQNTAYGLTPESIDQQIASLEKLKAQQISLINSKIESLKSIQSTFQSPKRSHRKSSSVYSSIERTQKFSEVSKNMKIVVNGCKSVGKSSLLMSFLGRNCPEFEKRDINSINRKVIIDDNMININIWEISNETSYKSLIKSCYYQAKAAIFMFDLTKPSTFHELNSQILNVKSNSPHLLFYILGTHLDDLLTSPSKREISPTTGQNLATKHQGFYSELNTLDPVSVLNFMKSLIHQVYIRSQQFHSPIP